MKDSADIRGLFKILQQLEMDRRIYVNSDYGNGKRPSWAQSGK